MKKVRFTDLIIFQNDDFLVINKPAGIASLDDRQSPGLSILGLAKGHNEALQLCHRLDKETSGVLILAKNQDAYRHVAMQLEHRELSKIYHAVVDGMHDLSQEVVDAPLIIMGNGIVRVDRNKGKKSKSIFTTLKAYRSHSLIECKIETGRMHQIRVHLASLGLNIVDDTLYGGKPIFLSSLKKKFNMKKNEDEQRLMKRIALHAYKVEFVDIQGDTIKVVAEYPKDFAVLLRQLEKTS